MGYEKALELLGKEESVPEIELTEIVVLEDQLEKVVDKEIADEPDSDRKASNEEINALRFKLSELEEKQQRDGEDVKGQLNGFNNVIAELQGQIKASPAIIQSGQILDTLEKLQSRLDKLEETLEAEIEAAMCPECGKIVGWNALPVEKYDEREVNPNKQSLFPSIIISLVYGKRCPVCKHFKEAEEEQKDIEAEE